jgi:sortase (surface protein transpeptidase)
MAPAGRATVLAALALGLATVPAGSQATGHDAAHATEAAARAADPALASFRSPRTYESVAAPVRLRIPAVRVDTSLQRLGRNADATIAVPDGPDTAGWYEQGPRPGQRGSAVILGHVDSADRPGVFFRLTELRPGDDVYVDREDGSTVGFRVLRLSQVPKALFPTDLVYLPTLQPSLQLVTCGGSFDHNARSYRDNVIVYTVPP